MIDVIIQTLSGLYNAAFSLLYNMIDWLHRIDDVIMKLVGGGV